MDLSKLEDTKGVYAADKSAVEATDNSYMKMGEVLQKREEFSVSLRHEKYKPHLNRKRQRINMQLTKAKFLLDIQKKASQGSEEVIELKDEKSLRDMIQSVDDSLRYSIGHQLSFTIDDQIQVVKEMYHVSKSISIADKHHEMYKKLIMNPQAHHVMLCVLTRDYAAQNVETEKLIELLGITAKALTNFISDDSVCESMNDQYELASVVNKLLERYFLSDCDILGINKTIDAGNVELFKSRLELMVEMLWLTNNIVSHEGQHAPRKANYSFAAQDIARTYMRLIQVYQLADEEIQKNHQRKEVLLNFTIWEMIAWGLSECSQRLVNNKKLEKIIEKKHNGLDQSQDAHAYYSSFKGSFYTPYESFIGIHLQTAIQLVNESEKDEQKLKNFHRDVREMIYNFAFHASSEDIVRVLGEELILNYIMQGLRSYDKEAMKQCIMPLGQLIAVSEDNVLENWLIQDKSRDNIFAILQYMLLYTSDQAHQNAIWTICNMSLNGDCADAILRSSINIYMSLIKSMQSTNERIAREAIIAVNNLILNCSDAELCRQMLKQDLLCVVNDLMMADKNQPLLKLLLNLLDSIFSNFPDQKDTFMYEFGTQALEKIQYTYDDDMYQLTQEFISKHFVLDKDDAHENDQEMASQFQI